MAATTRKGTRARKTRDEVQQELEEIQQEVASATAEQSTADRERETKRAVELNDAVQDLDVDALVHRLSSLGLDVSRAISELTAKLVSEANLLVSLKETVTLARRELSELHKIDIAATALEQLVDDYETKRRSLSAEREQALAAWEAEKANHVRDQKEYEDSLKKQRQREREEYEYQKTVERKRDEDTYAQKLAESERKQRERWASSEKDWQEREARLAASEQELERLRKESQEFPQRLNDAVAKGVADAIAAAERGYQHEAALAKKEVDAERRVAELRVQGLETALRRQQGELEIVQRKLDDASRQVQDIAIKAIEGASGSQALLHVNKIAMEQAKKIPQA